MELGKKTGGRWYSQHINVKRYIRERDNYTCQLCGAEGWIVDHIIPYAVSHDSTIDNLRVLCHACNLKARRQRVDTRLPVADWYRQIQHQLQYGY